MRLMITVARTATPQGAQTAMLHRTVNNGDQRWCGCR